MQWIILIGDEKFNFLDIKKIKHPKNIKIDDVDAKRFVVDYGEDHIFYDDVDLTSEYTEEELSLIPFLKPHFVMMVYTSEKLMEKVLLEENFPKEIYIDNDHGLIVPIGEFIKLIKNKKKNDRNLLGIFRKNKD